MENILELAIEQGFDREWLDAKAIKEKEKSKGTPGLLLIWVAPKFVKFHQNAKH